MNSSDHCDPPSAKRTWWLPSRRAIRITAFVTMLVSAVMVLVVLIAPGKYQIGFLRVSLRSGRNPGLALVVSAVTWYLVAKMLPENLDRLREAILGTWRASSIKMKIWTSLVIVQGLLLMQSWLGFPDHVLSLHQWTLQNHLQPIHEEGDLEFANLEHFAALCRHELPADARILFHGYIEGMVFAYEVYPRKVFMHPREYFEIAKTWHKQRWLEGIPDDPLEPFWHQGFPTEFVDQETFVNEHQITHEVWFDETNPTACRWRQLR